MPAAGSLVRPPLVGVNGSHVFSGNAQDASNTSSDVDYGYGYDYEEPTFQGNQQGIGSTTVGANGSGVVSGNVQQSENTAIDSEGFWGPYFGY